MKNGVDQIHFAPSEDPSTIPVNPPHASGPMEWGAWIARIKAGDSSASDELYRALERGVRRFFARRLDYSQVDDRVQELFLILFKSILAGKIQSPERLPGYVHTVAQRLVTNSIDESVKARNRFAHPDEASIPSGRDCPDGDVCARERSEFMARMIQKLPPRDREILTRFYLSEETPEQICREMGLTETQFRLYKSRAKERLTDQCQQTLMGKPVKAVRVLRQVCSA